MLRFRSLIVSVVGLGLLAAPSPVSAQDGIPDLLGDWTLTETSADGDTTTTEWQLYVHDPAEGLFFARIGEYEDETALMTGKIKGREASLSIDHRDDLNRWDLLTGTISTAPDLTIAGISVQHYGSQTGDYFDTTGTFEMRRRDDGTGTSAASPTGDVEAIARDAEPDATEAQGLRGGVSSSTDTAAQPVTATVACDASRLDAAVAALGGPTPYTAMTSLQSYDGKSDELAFALLVEEHVVDPVNWERTTNIPAEAGWSVFETRRLGDEVWTRFDGGDWSVEAPAAGVLGTPWALNILIEELMPGGQAADPAVIWNQVGAHCIVSQLFRVEDGGAGRGRTSRLTFVGDEVLPRTIEWEAVRPPTGRIKGKATRPGEIESILITVARGVVEPIEAPPAAE